MHLNTERGRGFKTNSYHNVINRRLQAWVRVVFVHANVFLQYYTVQQGNKNTPHDITSCSNLA